MARYPFLIKQFCSHNNCLTRASYLKTIYCEHFCKNNYNLFRHCQTHSVLNDGGSISVNKNILKKKIDNLVAKYEQITGMDEVRNAQNRVIDAQDKFVIAQDKRRELLKNLTNIQNKLKEVYAELDATTRGEERYLNLVTKEHSLLKEERKLTAEFNLSEREERECFTYLSSSLKESHEKERAQAERTKYWSVIGSIIGTVLGVVGSTINNEFKMRELRKLVVESVTHNHKTAEADNIAASVISRHEEQLSHIISELRSINNNQSPNHSNILPQLLYNVDNQPGESPIEVMLRQHKHETRLILGFAVVFIPVIVVCINRFM